MKRRKKIMAEFNEFPQATQDATPETAPAKESIVQRLIAATDGYKTGAGIVLLFLAYAFTEHCRIWGIDLQSHAWINPISETLNWWGQMVLCLGGGHKMIKNKEFFQKIFDEVKIKSTGKVAEGN
jgi:hypothetical protein